MRCSVFHFGFDCFSLYLPLTLSFSFAGSTLRMCAATRAEQICVHCTAKAKNIIIYVGFVCRSFFPRMFRFVHSVHSQHLSASIWFCFAVYSVHHSVWARISGHRAWPISRENSPRDQQTHSIHRNADWCSENGETLALTGTFSRLLSIKHNFNATQSIHLHHMHRQWFPILNWMSHLSIVCQMPCQAILLETNLFEKKLIRFH